MFINPALTDAAGSENLDKLFFTCVQNGRIDLSGLITHEFSPHDCEAAYTLAEQQREQAMGILYDWSRVSQ